MVEMATHGTHTYDSPNDIIATAEEKLKQIAESRSSYFRKAYVTKVKDYKFYNTTNNHTPTEFTTSKIYLAFLIALGILNIAIAVAISIYIKAPVGIIFCFPLGFIILEYLRKYKVKAVVNSNGISVSNEFTPWHEILQCYIMDYSTTKVVYWSLFIITHNGAVKEYAIDGLKHRKLSKAIFRQLQHYRATSAQPS